MPPVPRIHLAALACLLAFVPAAHAEDRVVELYLRAHLTLAADGAPEAIEWGHERQVPDALKSKLEARIRSWTFEPGTLDGTPVRTETTLRLRLTATPASPGGDAYRIRFDNAETGPTMDPVPPPHYPRDAIRGNAEAQVLAELRVDADGTRHVGLARYEGRDRFRKQFEQAAADMLASVGVRPERVGGIEVAARFAIPVSFCINTCDGPDLVFDGDDGSSLPTTAPGAPVPQGSVARLVTEVAGTSI